MNSIPLIGVPHGLNELRWDFSCFSSIKVLPTPGKRTQQRNKGMAENIQSLV